LINKDLLNQYHTPGDLINLLNFAKKNKINLNEFTLKEFLIYLIKNNLYKKDIYIKSNIANFIELYFYKKFFNNNDKGSSLNIYSQFMKKYNYMYKFNLDVDSYFMEFKSKILNG